jgi:hypothetical protein
MHDAALPRGYAWKNLFGVGTAQRLVAPRPMDAPARGQNRRSEAALAPRAACRYRASSRVAPPWERGFGGGRAHADAWRARHARGARTCLALGLSLLWVHQVVA